MVYLILLTLIFITKRIRQKKIIPVLWIVYLAALSAFNPDCPDRWAYLAYYQYFMDPESVIVGSFQYNRFEPGFRILNSFFAGMHINFDVFLFIVFLTCYAVTYVVGTRYIREKKWFFILYFIFPFFINTVQIRLMIATTILFASIWSLKNAQIKNIIRYVFFVWVAMLFHTSSVFALVYVLIPLSKRKGFREVMAVCSALLAGLIYSGYFAKIIARYVPFLIVGGSWMDVNYNKTILAAVFVNMIWIYVFYRCRKTAHLFVAPDRLDIVDFVYRINLTSLLLLPLTLFGRQFLRMYRVYTMVNYIGMFQYLQTDGIGKRRKYNMMAMFLAALMILICLDEIAVVGNIC